VDSAKVAAAPQEVDSDLDIKEAVVERYVRDIRTIVVVLGHTHLETETVHGTTVIKVHVVTTENLFTITETEILPETIATIAISCHVKTESLPHETEITHHVNIAISTEIGNLLIVIVITTEIIVITAEIIVNAENIHHANGIAIIIVRQLGQIDQTTAHHEIMNPTEVETQELISR
jgi:hypothetical protein